jgi:hypothetical protein
MGQINNLVSLMKVFSFTPFWYKWTCWHISTNGQPCFNKDIISLGHIGGNEGIYLQAII